MTDGTAFLMSYVACHAQRLQVDFGTGDGRAEIEEQAVFEVLDLLFIEEKIAVGGDANGSRISSKESVCALRHLWQ